VTHPTTRLDHGDQMPAAGRHPAAVVRLLAAVWPGSRAPCQRHECDQPPCSSRASARGETAVHCSDELENAPPGRAAARDPYCFGSAPEARKHRCDVREEPAVGPRRLRRRGASLVLPQAYAMRHVRQAARLLAWSRSGRPICRRPQRRASSTRSAVSCRRPPANIQTAARSPS